MQPGQGCDTVSMAADADADDTDGGDSDDDDDDWQAMILLLRMQEENRPQKCASQVELVSGMQGSRRVNFATANLGMCKELQACLALPNGKHTSEMSKKSKLGLKLDYPFKAPVHEVVHLAPCIEALLGWQPVAAIPELQAQPCNSLSPTIFAMNELPCKHCAVTVCFSICPGVCLSLVNVNMRTIFFRSKRCIACGNCLMPHLSSPQAPSQQHLLLCGEELE
eukprot:scaffold98006_cov17-Tisochrysis_lutea.AAC.1